MSHEVGSAITGIMSQEIEERREYKGPIPQLSAQAGTPPVTAFNTPHLVVSTSSQQIYSGIKPLALRSFRDIWKSIKSHNDLENGNPVTIKAGLMPISWNLKSSHQTQKHIFTLHSELICIIHESLL